MNVASRAKVATLAIAVAGLMGNSAFAGDGKDARCGFCGRGGSGAVCVLTKTTKTLKIDCFDCAEEIICIPGKSRRGCKNTELACDGNACKDGSCRSCKAGKGDGRGTLSNKKFVWYEWSPVCGGKGKGDCGNCNGNGGYLSGCAKAKTVKHLVVREVTKEVPSYEWVTSKCCDGCKGKVKGADIEPGVEVPEPPPVEAKLLYGNPQNLPVRFEQRAAYNAPADTKRSYVEILTSLFGQ